MPRTGRLQSRFGRETTKYTKYTKEAEASKSTLQTPGTPQAPAGRLLAPPGVAFGLWPNRSGHRPDATTRSALMAVTRCAPAERLVSRCFAPARSSTPVRDARVRWPKSRPCPRATNRQYNEETPSSSLAGTRRAANGEPRRGRERVLQRERVTMVCAWDV